jgi:WD40 repeat protein
VVHLPEIKIDKGLTRMIKRNLPVDYDTTGLSDEFREMINVKDPMIVSGCDKTLKLWDMESGECIQTFTGHRCSVESVALSPDGSQLVSGSRDYMLKLWNVETGECIRTYTGHQGSVCSVAWSPDSNSLVSSSFDTLKLWSVETGDCIRTFTGHCDSVNSAAIIS